MQVAPGLLKNCGISLGKTYIHCGTNVVRSGTDLQQSPRSGEGCKFQSEASELVVVIGR